MSFGKDSTVLLNLAIEVARRLNRLPVHVMFVDLEAQYRTTEDLARETFDRPEVTGHWVCLPLNLRNAVSMYQPFWTCWGPKDRSRWVRPLPKHPAVVSDPAFFPFFRPHMEWEQFVEAYGTWFAEGGVAAGGVGIRSDESLNRFRTVASTVKQRWEGHAWTTQRGSTVLFFPLYDWRTEDIWTAIGRNRWAYNRIYDAMYLAGWSIHESRLCQPFGDDQRRGLDLFHRCEPDTWAKVVGRVSGANFGKHHVRGALLGFRHMHKPEAHTWESYTRFLLNTLPAYERAWYEAKFNKFFAWWAARGVPLVDEADPKLEAARKVPSWRRLARVVLTNDKLCRSLSFGQTSRQWETYQEMKRVHGF